MAPEPRTRLNVRVRIAAHAITATALGALASPTFAASPPGTVHRISLEGSPEVLATAAERHGLGRDHGFEQTGYAYATEAQLQALDQAGQPWHPAPPPPPPEAAYRMPDEGGALLASLATASDRAGLAVLGHSVEGRPIEALWLGQPPESGAPVHRVLGGHHGDEWSAIEVALATAEALAEGDGTDPGITALLDQVTIWVVPYVNPDGVQAKIRWNANGVDLNRNYGYEWTDEEFLPGEAPFSEPETRAIRAFGHWTQPVLGLSLHSGATNFGWVWNYTTQPAADESALEAQAERYAAVTTQPDFWITNGADWYVTHGDTNDWSYGRHGVWDSTLELTEDKAPPALAIPTFVGDHLPAMLDFVSVLPDLSARVLDAESGLPVDASVVLLDADGPVGRPFRTEPGTGWFHRLDPYGALDVEVRAPGYRAAVVPTGTETILLERDGLDPRPVLPAPALSGDLLELPLPLDGAAVLSQPGHPPVTALAAGGLLQLGASQLAPGAWTVQLSDGTTLRHGLLRPSVSSPVGVQLEGDAVHLTGVEPLPGARVWALFGEGRARLPLPATLEPDGLRVDLAEVPDGGRVDLWIVSGGLHQFATDLYDSDPVTWGLGPRDRKPSPTGCACNVKPGHLPGPTGSWILTPLFLLLLRRSP